MAARGFRSHIEFADGNHQAAPPVVAQVIARLDLCSKEVVRQPKRARERSIKTNRVMTVGEPVTDT